MCLPKVVPIKGYYLGDSVMTYKQMNFETYFGDSDMTYKHMNFETYFDFQLKWKMTNVKQFIVITLLLKIK